MICLIENKVYNLGTDTLKAVLTLAKEKYIKEKKYAIYAVKDKKEDVYDLKRQEFKTLEELNETVQNYREQEFEVYYTQGG